MSPEMELSRELLAGVAIAAPAGGFAILGLSWLAGYQPSEKAIARITAAVHVIGLIAVFALAIEMKLAGLTHVSVSLGNWFEAGEYRFPLSLLADRLSLPMMALSLLLGGLTGSFSRRYLHRDRGYFRFFVLLHLFTFGSLLAFASGSLDLLIGGWELVGLTSVLLIAFFNERREPVRNALRVFATYRICDLGLLIGVFVLHHAIGSAAWSTLFTGSWPDQSAVANAGAATLAAALLLLAAMGKSAQLPFSGWLPRAMEGPTPSSAIFYGAISVHLGAYLLLRIQPLLDLAPAVRVAVVLLGFVTAVHATLSGRAASDAKTSLAYASMAQVSLIFIEAGMGWTWLALVHTVSHAAVRTLQFLRAPSMLHDYHRVHAAAGGQLGRTGLHYERLLPAPLRRKLYWMALDGGHVDTFLDRYIIDPVLGAAGNLASVEASLAEPSKPTLPPAATLKVQRTADVPQPIARGRADA